MGGPARATRGREQQQQQQPQPPQPSSGTTIFDGSFTEPSDSVGYATPQKTETVSPRTERSRLSQSSEPLAIRQPNNGDECDNDSSIATLCSESDPLGTHMKEVISVISRLEGLGLQQQSIPLPKCVILGEQSSGKSSVIEAISGVRTPRAGGTCTRCPLFIKLECASNPQASWHARVTLRLSYEYKGAARGAKFPGWEPNLNVPEVPFAVCSSPEQLEEVIRRAQLALVHPLEDAMIFAQGRVPTLNPDQTLRVNFSPNIVCIHLSAPTLPNLSFYDLPGIISQSENPDDVKLVKQLVQGFVEDPDAIVLVACSLAADIATSIASGYARTRWGAGGRCIGVLTKPDLLPAGSSYEPLQRVLNNVELKFGHGYFVVKNPDQVMLNNRLKHHDARLHEQKFFASQEPWATSLRSHNGRFGTANLQQFLSQKLAGQMVKALPGIYEQVQLRLDDVDAELRRIPEPPPNHGATRIIMDLINAFSDHVRKEVEGAYPCKDWRNSWKDLREAFFDGLDAMRPTMMRRGQQDLGLYHSTFAGKSSDDPLCLSDGDDDEEMGNSALPETPQNKRKLDYTTPTPTSNKKSRFSVPPIPTPAKMRPVHGVDYNDKRKAFQLDDVRQHLDANSQSKIPGHIEPKVVDDLVRQTIAHWSVPMGKLFIDLDNCLKTFVRMSFEQHFQPRKDTKLYTDAWKIVENILDTSLVEQRTMAGDAFNDEIEGPYTFHKAIFNSEKNSMSEKYRKARFDTRIRIYMEEMAQYVGQEKVPSKEKLVKNENLCSRLKEEPYEVEVDVVAQITSYYVLAVRRFHDSICMRIESKFFTRLRSKLRDEIEETLGIHDEDGTRKAMELLAEPSQHAARRKELLAMRDALLEGRGELDALYEKHGNKLAASQGSHGYAAPLFNSSASFGTTSTPLTDEMHDITQSGRVRR
ncbi:P-loop containing nucleoside triphosphate hydrolase protein [Karstenula rhodostoma CBS 690.94]|uniref:P-loop containing nucleoside triphosphate hydrolase protein n=1 Tax=Karstenula rhodostoma CBS 690.94 TaxID=1392251 RepID=A0A9P4P7Q1_9PLEO|nr:P-loop containing nucleoside triphosphate hydrolase protein [Karstenula rhodostoma CBS 690.94]